MCCSCLLAFDLQQLSLPQNFNEAVFCLQGKKPLHTGVRTGCHCLVSLSACLLACLSVWACVTFAVFTVRGRLPQTRDLWKRASMG